METKKKKMSDISRPDRAERPKKKIHVEKEMEKKLEEIDKQVERFEKEEKKRFEAEEVKKVKRKGFHSKKKIIIASSVVLATILIYLGLAVLPRADIKIITKKSEWNYVDSVIANKSAAEFSTSSKQIPAEVFSLVKNFNFSFPATGKGNVQRKATGKITIYNVSSIIPQPLVATTRFQSPDGKVFHLVNRVIVPAVVVSGGKNVPSSIEADVIADKAGSDYNIGPVSRFNIPGFLGSDKYKIFYGESKEAMTDGFIGEAAFPTDADIKQAKNKAYGDLKDYIDSLLIGQMPEGLKLIDGARQFSITSEEVKQGVDEGGNFNIFLEGKSSIIAFKEEDVLSLITALARKDLGEDFNIFSKQLEYGAGRPNFNAGKISFAVDFKGIFEKSVDIDGFRKQALSRSEADLKNLISSYDGIEKATISFWPFWVKSVPDSQGRIKIKTE